MSLSDESFVLNCSRTTLHGGLRTFTDEVMLALVAERFHFGAVVPRGFAVPPGVRAIETPASLAGMSDLSLLRPVKWFVYSRFRFPVATGQRVLSTTHQALPGRGRQIVTIHDLRPYFYPDTPVQGFYFRHMLPRALKRCDGVFTVSATSRQLISEVYGVASRRIWVVPNVIVAPQGADVGETGGNTLREEPYLLMVGASWPHKNVESLLQQHALWAAEYRLVVVAGPGQYRTRMEELTTRLGLAARVRFRGGVTREELGTLYRECAALVTPSRMEGFGIPALEAMAWGRPVIAADIPVYRDLYGPHAIYVDTAQSKSWASAFTALRTVPAEQLQAARIHALGFTRDRMRAALREALHAVWGL